MAPFNHAKVISMATERKHHTRQGLHLNKKGKHWIANNLTKEIRNSCLPLNINPPIVLKWKNIKENITQQTDPATVIRRCDETKPPSPEVERSNSWMIGNRCTQDEDPKQHSTLISEQTQTAPPQQEKLPNRMSCRKKKMPATKSDNFLW
jgi:hypothetical protein